jgi:hypothetical protein
VLQTPPPQHCAEPPQELTAEQAPPLQTPTTQVAGSSRLLQLELSQQDAQSLLPQQI